MMRVSSFRYSQCSEKAGYDYIELISHRLLSPYAVVPTGEIIIVPERIVRRGIICYEILSSIDLKVENFIFSIWFNRRYASSVKS